MSKIKQLLAEYPFLVKLFNNIPTGIYICDTEETIIFVNDATETIDEVEAKKVVGRKIDDVYDSHESAMRKVLETNRDVDHFLCRYSRNERQINQICNGFPIIIDGITEGACSIEYNTDFFREIIKNQRTLQQRFVNTKNSTDSAFGHIIGKSPSFLNCLSIATLAAQSDSAVFLTGPTGSGKEVFAKAIHSASARKEKSFIAVNCAAIPETLIESILFGTTKGIYTGAVDRKGIFEQAQGGTLFLDELNSMPLTSQAKLLRVLEEKKVTRLGSKDSIDFDIHLISSSNMIPQKAIENKSIREDLFYRLAVVNILIPSLAERQSDILPLCQHFIEHYNEKFNKNIISVNDAVKDILVSYNWPGNIRQLKHCIESAMNFVSAEDTQITEKHMMQFLAKIEIGNCASDIAVSVTSDTDKTKENENVFKKIESNEKQAIIDALLKNKGNVTYTAEQLNMSRQSLNYRMQKYGIKRRNE
ncbi:sigma-54 interaction domain-containing protein [Sporomusa sphaeroides]|uniref:Arginine utilization regulatory protein RocR n=1 Tax=Sporomusa sphaeroides DSM 2875 TaxID=1337886 RepID=A0ABM9W6Q5_9FIRM|nr:sigma 54-interacting transcriptional regulator [Sporomusa sphaeroides]OLS54621.1 arginine utilization regulatory protein RocR [Sporomusa sphaeroides DSM 2875]CVK20848.1 Arginine utilization regulatory protein RocR [Sporomusa sphaeroides DSM 2875]